MYLYRIKQRFSTSEHHLIFSLFTFMPLNKLVLFEDKVYALTIFNHRAQK